MKKKTLFILLISCFFVLLISSTCFASEIEFDYSSVIPEIIKDYDSNSSSETNTIDLVKQYKYFFITSCYTSNSQVYTVVCSNDKYILSNSENNVPQLSGVSSNPYIVNYEWKPEGTTRNVTGISSNCYDFVSLVGSSFSYLSGNYVPSNLDNEPYFSGATPNAPEISENPSPEIPTDDNNTILPNVFNNVNLKDVFFEIIKLLPVMLLVLIGFIALRKGITFFINFLRSA